MGLLGTWRRNRAAKRYARLLPDWLQRNYGASERYTLPQIAHGIAAQRLDPRFVVLALAAYQSEAEFEELRPQMPIAMEYAEARDLFERFVPPKLTSAYGEPGPIRSG
jgi:hypothetical protein